MGQEREVITYAICTQNKYITYTSPILPSKSNQKPTSLRFIFQFTQGIEENISREAMELN